MRKTTAAFLVSCGLAGTLACSASTPLTPEQSKTGSGAAADGSTLKVGAPTLVSPINDVVLLTQKPTLSVSKATGQFSPTTVFQYEFELQSDAGAVIARGTVSGTDFTVPDNLGTNGAFRWRARAVLSGAFGPYSPTGRFLTPRITTPTASSSDNDWKTFFFSLIDLRGVGPNTSVDGLAVLEPDLTAAGVLVQKTSGGQIRPRIYLPTGNPSNLYGRTVDLGDLGKPWQWIPRGSTTCEGICK